MRKNLFIIILFGLLILISCEDQILDVYNDYSENETGSITYTTYAKGELDTDFNVGSGANEFVWSTIEQPDGKILMVGAFTYYNGTAINGIIRLNVDGSRDVSFDSYAQANLYIRCIARQSDGKILIGGDFSTYFGTSRSHIARLNSDGTLDTTFDPGTGMNGHVSGIHVLADSKIIAIGSFSEFNGDSRPGIVKLNSDGTLDTSFNPGTGAASAIVICSAIQNDGKIVIGGEFSTFNNTARNRIARLNADGSLDLSFDPGTGADVTVYSISVLNSGKTMIAGQFGNYNGTGRKGIALLNFNGSLDTSFDPGVGSNSSIYNFAVQDDGRIVVGGSFTTFDSTSRKGIARLNSNGSLDASFNPGTGATSDVFVQSISLLKSGRIIIAGGFTFYNDTSINRIARLK